MKPHVHLRAMVIVAVLAALAGREPVEARVVYVSADASDSNDGSNWAAAKATVQAGLDVAAAGDELWVKAGTYVECITLKEGVGLYGGFAGQETELSQRNWTSNKTILDGNASGSVVTAPPGVTSSARIDGFTIRNGSASGITCDHASPGIFNNRITGNNAGSRGAGGGVYCDYSSPTIGNNIISGNVANYNGGGITCGHSSSTIVNNTITHNFAGTVGGGIDIHTSSPTISNNIVAFNSSGLHNGTSAPNLKNNCVYNPRGTNYLGLSAGADDISTDPQFLGAEYGDWHLQLGSACIDAGLDGAAVPGSVDLDGQLRIRGEHVDIGADEFDGVTPAFTPKVVRVRPFGNDAHDGSRWDLAKSSVQAAINSAADGGGGEVWVAAGTYGELISVKSWVHVYGGFGGAENCREERDFRAHSSILDAAGGGNVVTASFPGLGSSTIDGFTIRNGHTGVFCIRASPVISNNTITANGVNASIFEGGAICCYYCSPAIFNNKITGNDAGPGGGGGGVFCSDSSPAIFNNGISGNTASSFGGGICLRSSSPAISNNTIVGNSSPAGGGVYCISSCSPEVSNNVIAFNSSGLYDGTPALRNNCLYNPDGTNYYNVSPGVGDISLDPLFVNRQAGDYRLASGSACIDAGYNAALPGGRLLDHDDHPRFFDDPATSDCQWSPGNCGTAPVVDMGAYEFIPAIPGDFDRDGDVDADDVSRFQVCASGPGAAYAGGCAMVDFDADEDVDQDDFGVLQRCLRDPWMPVDFNCAH